MIKLVVLHTVCSTVCFIENRQQWEQHMLIESDYVINNLGNVCSEHMQRDWFWYNRLILNNLN